MKKRLIEIFTVDVRSLALMRIGVGAILLIDLFQRARFLEEHYTDFGLAPRWAQTQFFSSPHMFSFHHLNGQSGAIALLFVLNAIFASCLLLGVRTKLMSAICWFFLISLHNRNTLILQGGDVLLRMMIFWGFFLPWGNRFSIDALRGRCKRDFGFIFADKHLYFSVASVALVLQMVILYTVAVVQKSGPEWHEEATAVWIALSSDHFVTDAGKWLRQFDSLLPTLTHLTIIAEWGLPFLLIFPFFFQQIRIVGIFALVGMHLSFALFMEIGLFWLIDIVFLLGLLPVLFWKRAARSSKLHRWKEEIEKSFRRALIRCDAVSARFSRRRWQKLGFALSNFIVGSVLLLIVAFVLPVFPFANYEFPKEYEWTLNVLGLDQRWAMFSPRPFTDDGWFVIDGKLRDHTAVDVLRKRQGPADYSKPPNLASDFVTQRWRKYFRILLRSPQQEVRLHYARSLCRLWSREAESPEKMLDSFQIWFVLELSKPYQEQPPEKHLVWKHYCFEVPEEERNTKALNAEGL